MRFLTGAISASYEHATVLETVIEGVPCLVLI